jgi:Uncharacterized protein conserved in bacteria (DUF2188)
MSAGEAVGREGPSRVREWARLADGLRQAHLEDVEQQQAAAEAGLHREAARLAARYGAGSAALLEAQARMRSAALLRAEVRSEMTRIGLAGSPIRPGVAVLHGRVVDSALEAVTGVNVAALDDEGATLAADRTDRRGYFRLEVRPGATEGPNAKDGEPVGEVPPAARVVLMVSDAGGAVLHRDTEATTLPAGAMVYREVLVAGPGEAETGTQGRVYHVTPNPAGGWSVQAEGATRATSTHPTKEEAVARARELARSHRPGRLIVHYKDGRIEAEHTYGEEPGRAPG